LSVFRCRLSRRVRDFLSFRTVFAKQSDERLPVVLYRHSSLIRRTLGNVEPRLQENKSVNLGIAAPKISHVLIRPGETFSFWRLVGDCTERKGYREGLTISDGSPSRGIGGGMCQLTNLIHWMVLHTPLTITEHHHHDGLDLFPDFGRQLPFGTGTSIVYNYLDYRFKNTTDSSYQLVVYTTDEYLCGEMRADRLPERHYHIKSEDETFTREGVHVYRNGKIYRECVDSRTGALLSRELLKTNHAKVLYDTSSLEITDIHD